MISPASNIVKYSVADGDTLSGIASRYQTSVLGIYMLNHIADVNAIAVGESLVLHTGWKPPGSIPASASPPGATEASVVALQPVVRPTYAAPSQAVDIPAVWACIAAHESGGNPATDTGNGFFGAFQDTVSSWDAAGGARYASLPNFASYADQLVVNEEIQRQQGWGAWPQTSLMCGV